MKRPLVPWKRKEEQLPAPSPNKATHPLEALHTEMNELLNRFFDDVWDFNGWPEVRSNVGSFGQMMPNVEVSETEDEFTVRAELPGMDEDDIQVHLDGDMLTIRGEKKSEHSKKRRKMHVSEMSYGSFYRAIPLPPGVDSASVKAKFKRGVLLLRIPRPEGAHPSRKRIAIEAG